MQIINTVLGVPLGYLMYFCYQIFQNYGLAIIIFTVLTKVILFPLSLVSQKNSIKMVKMQPMLEEIRQRNAGNNALIIEEQKALYKQEKYSTFVGMVPLLLQIPLILGLINVIYNPLQHLLHLPQETIQALIRQTMQLLSEPDLGFGAQLRVMETVQAMPETFQGMGMPEVLAQIQQFDFSFLGLNLSVIPSWTSVTLLIPILSGLSALVLSLAQNRGNVLQQEQGALSKWGMTIFLVIFSGYFAFVVPCGIGLYWIAGNLLSILVMVICNRIYNPKKYIDYENRTQKPKLTKEERAEKRTEKKLARTRERADNKRFFSRQKELVFYAESGGFYKYFARIIDYLLEHSDITIHYVTSDLHDPILENNNPRMQSYYIGGNALIAFMMKMDADMVIMTMPDLEQYHIKRSIVRKDVEYVYLDHGMASLHMMLREGALDHYDTIFCYGPNHIAEVRAMEELSGTKEKKLVKTGYGLLDTLLENVAEMQEEPHARKHILIAPSWQKDNIMESCLDDLLAPLLERDYCIIVRPHPEFVKRFAGKMKAIITRYQDRLDENFIIQTDFSSNRTVYTADLVITDWSSIAQEFSYATKKPSLFINTTMKVMNPNYKKIPLVPLDVSLRDEIGHSLNPDALDKVAQTVEELLAHTQEYQEKITQVLQENIYNIGSSAQAAGDYILEALAQKEAQRKTEQEAMQIP